MQEIEQKILESLQELYELWERYGTKNSNWYTQYKENVFVIPNQKIDQNIKDHARKKVIPYIINFYTRKNSEIIWNVDANGILFFLESDKNWEEFSRQPGITVCVEHWWESQNRWLFDDYLIYDKNNNKLILGSV